MITIIIITICYYLFLLPDSNTNTSKSNTCKTSVAKIRSEVTFLEILLSFPMRKSDSAFYKLVLFCLWHPL